MSDDTLRTEDGRQVLRMERRLAHPRAKVWRALTEPEQLRQWFPASVEYDAGVGGKVRYAFEGQEPGEGGDGEVTAYDPPRLFEFTWTGTILRWELLPEPGGTLLVFTHVFDDRPGAASFAAGWNACIAALGTLLDGGEPQPSGRMVAEHERRVREFGLDQGAVDKTEDGFRVRFERQLTAPAERAWQVATGGAAVAVGGPAPAGLGGGTITAVDPPSSIELDAPDGHVSWRLGEGTGHGARLIVTQTGPTDTSAAWRDRIEALAAVVADEAD